MNPMLKVAVKVKDRVELQKKIFDALKHLGRQDVLVGIPQEAASERGSVNQAELAFIHTYGSPARGIPARPFLEPAIEKGRDEIAGYLKRASESASQGNIAGVDGALKRTGVAGEKHVKGHFRDDANGWPPNKPATIRRKGSDLPLIDTGSMRDAITYVIREKGAPR